jgi:hypothetical protein
MYREGGSISLEIVRCVHTDHTMYQRLLLVCDVVSNSFAMTMAAQLRRVVTTKEQREADNLQTHNCVNHLLLHSLTSEPPNNTQNRRRKL